MRQKTIKNLHFYWTDTELTKKDSLFSSNDFSYDLSILSFVSISQTPEEAKYVLHIFRTNKEVNVQNEHMIKQVCFQVNISRATDFYKNAVNGEIAQRDEPYSTFASEDLLDILELGIGARAMLVRNINTEDGLVNGAFGTITGLEKSSDNVIKAVYVRFDHPQSGKKTYLQVNNHEHNTKTFS